MCCKLDNERNSCIAVADERAKRLWHWRLVCSIWKPKYCRKTDSPYFCPWKGNQEEQWTWQFSVKSGFVFFLTWQTYSMFDPYMWSWPGTSPYWPSGSWPQPGIHSSRKEYDCCHPGMEVFLCAGGHCFQSLLSAYALHLIVHMTNGFTITVFVPVTWEILKTQLKKSSKLRNMSRAYIPK